MTGGFREINIELAPFDLGPPLTHIEAFIAQKTRGQRAAAIYSLLGTAKLNGHNPEAFIRAVLERIADHPINRINELLPWNLHPTHATPRTGANAAPVLSP